MEATNISKDRSAFLETLDAIVGRARVLTDPVKMRPFCTGYRFGGGPALAVIRPNRLVDLWRVLEVCIAANKIIIMQASNTGLTGGSTPAGEDYDRDVVLVNPMAVAGVHLIDGGRQVICLPGATLHQLEAILSPLGREPHSVIGSSCIGASVMGGICNNSGGALVRRGPAFTEMALFARLDEAGILRLVNHLGVRLGDDPEEILTRLEQGDFTAADIEVIPDRRGSDHDYARRIRDVDADVPTRFNSDPRCLFEASGSAGKLALFAVRLDTFPQESETQVLYVGTNDPAEFTAIRRQMLSNFENLPVSAEYMHRTAFNIAECYGKDTFLAIHHLGSGQLPRLFELKARFDGLTSRLGSWATGLSDRLLQGLGRLFPSHLPKRMKSYRDRYAHHLILKMAGPGVHEAIAYLDSIFPSFHGDFFICTQDEGSRAFLHRFAAAGAAVRYRAVHAKEVEDIVALDIALRANERDWFERLPDHVTAPILHTLYYGHFFCHVFHHDYIVRKGCDAVALEHAMWALLDARGAEYPAEHNTGHLYRAKPSLVDFHRALDPCNAFNPGIGQTSKRAHWRQEAAEGP